MATNDFKKYMAPDFQAQSAPALQWMPWQEDTMQSDANNIGGTINQLKPKPAAKGGAMAGAEGKAGASPMGAGKGGASL